MKIYGDGGLTVQVNVISENLCQYYDSKPTCDERELNC